MWSVENRRKSATVICLLTLFLSPPHLWKCFFFSPSLHIQFSLIEFPVLLICNDFRLVYMTLIYFLTTWCSALIFTMFYNSGFIMVCGLKGNEIFTWDWVFNFDQKYNPDWEHLDYLMPSPVQLILLKHCFRDRLISARCQRRFVGVISLLIFFSEYLSWRLCFINASFSPGT